MTPVLILIAATTLGAAPIVSSSAEYVAQLAAASSGSSQPAAERRAPPTPEEFGIQQTQCISHPAAPTGEVMICEGKATRIPARAVGRDIALPKPVRAYVETRDGTMMSISLDGDELQAFGDVLRDLERSLSDVPVCDGASTPSAPVWLGATGYIIATRVPVPDRFAPTGASKGRASIAILQFTSHDAGIECEPPVGKRQQRLEDTDAAGRVVEDL